LSFPSRWGNAKPALHAKVLGDGPPVLLLHGQPGNASDWEAVGEDLAKDHMVVAPDRPGYGLTGGSAVGFRDNALAIAELLRRLEIDGAVVAGHSWGGGVALQLAVDSPQHVRGLVLVCSIAPGEPLGRLDRLLARPILGKALVALSLSTAGKLLSWGPARALAGRRFGWQRLEAIALSWRSRSTWSSFTTEQRALVYELPGLSSAVRSIRAPAVVMVGSADKLVPPEVGRRLSASLQSATFKVIPAAGHLLPQLYPKEVADAVRGLAVQLSRP